MFCYDIKYKSIAKRDNIEKEIEIEYDIEYKIEHMKSDIEKRKVEIEKFKQTQKNECEKKEKQKNILKLKEREDRTNRKKVEIIKLRSKKIKIKNDEKEFKQNNYRKQINNMYLTHFINLNGIHFDAINHNINTNLTMNVALAHFDRIKYDFNGHIKPILTKTIDSKAYNITYEYFIKMDNYRINDYLFYNLGLPKIRCSIIINYLNKINNEVNFVGYFCNNKKINWFDYKDNEYNSESNRNEYVYIVCELKNKSCFG
jgi:hypothetical protein